MNTHQTRPVSSNHSSRTQYIMEECWARDLGYNDMLELLWRSLPDGVIRKNCQPSRKEYKDLCQSMTKGMEESFQSFDNMEKAYEESQLRCVVGGGDYTREAPETLTTLQMAFRTKLTALEFAAEQLIGSTLANPPEGIEASEAIVAFEILKEINKHRTYLGDVHPCVFPGFKEADFEIDPELCEFDRTGQEPEQ